MHTSLEAYQIAEAGEFDPVMFHIQSSEAMLHRAAAHYKQFLETLGLYNPETMPDIVDTPMRVAKMLREMTTPTDYTMTSFDLPKHANGEVGDVGIVLQKDIDFASLCSHHMMPFFGIAHVAYIPGRQMVGLSKLARTVRFMAHSIGTQEALGSAVADCLWEELEPKGVAVIIKATHSCMSCRGALASSATTTTSALRGVFFTYARARAELYEMLKV